MAEQSERLSESRLVAILQDEERKAIGYYSNDVAEEQDKSLDYYYGEKFGDEREGHSQVVSRDVAEVVDWAIPSLMRMFVGNDEAVVYEPTSEDTADLAEHQTVLANHQFYQENDGFSIVHDWLKDGLLQKIGIVKVFWDATPRKVRKTFEDLTPEGLVGLRMGLPEGARIIEHTEHDGLHDITAMYEMPGGKVCIVNVPPEEFLIARRSRDVESSDYLAHRTRTTKSALIEAGYDPKIIEGLSFGSESQDLDERENNRFEDEDYSDKGDDSQDPSMRSVWQLGEEVLIDANGDGVAELRKIVRVGSTILENMEIEDGEFVDFCPVPMPHKAIGMSLADQTMDLQRIKSVVLRQALDNMYLSNNPRMEAPRQAIGEDTLDDLLMNIPGGIVRTEMGGQLNPITVPFVAGNAFDMLGYLDGQREQRTGITKYNQGLDADTLNKTATGVSLIQDAGQDRLELIARIFANSMARLFKKILKLNKRHGTQPRNIRNKGQWVQVDPSQFDDTMNVTVQVGLGTGKKDQRLAYRRELMAMQEKAFAMGGVRPEHFFKSVQGFVKDTGLGEASEYFATPEEMMAQPEKPDPAVVEAEQKASLEMRKLEMEDARKREQMEREHALKLEQMAREADLAREEMILKARMGIGGGAHGLSSDANFGGQMG